MSTHKYVPTVALTNVEKKLTALPMSSGSLWKFMLASFCWFVSCRWSLLCVCVFLACCRTFDGWMLLSKRWTPTAKETLFSMLIRSDNTMTDPIKNSSPTTNKSWVGLRVFFSCLLGSLYQTLSALLTNFSLTTNLTPALGNIFHGLELR